MIVWVTARGKKFGHEERKGEILLHSYNKRVVKDLMKNFSIHVQKHHILSIYIQHVGKHLASRLKII